MILEHHSPAARKAILVTTSAALAMVPTVLASRHYLVPVLLVWAALFLCIAPIRLQKAGGAIHLGATIGVSLGLALFLSGFMSR